MPEPLRVGIIGAGIGGLSAAIGLRRAGAEVEIFERSTFKDEAGAAITITPNGSRILESWGMHHSAAHGVEAQTVCVLHASSLEVAVEEDVNELRDEFGAGMMFYHRADLHATLRRMAWQEIQSGGDMESDGTPAVAAEDIRRGCEVVDVDCEGGVIELADGRVVRKDMVVISDGIRSRFVGCVTGDNASSVGVDTGWSSYRCLVPLDAVLRDEQTKPFFEGRKPGFWIPFDVSRGFYMAVYPCRANRMLNIVIRHNTRPKDRDKSGWNCPAALDDVLDLLSDYHPALARIVPKVPEGGVKIFKYLRREPLHTYNRGRAVLLGDAAATVLPTHAQGSVLAIEEAAALEMLFSGGTTADQVASKLQMYTQVLKAHIHINQHLADTIPGKYDPHWHHAEMTAAAARSAGMAMPPLYPCGSYGFSLPVRRFFYSYDVRAAVARAVKCERESNKTKKKKCLAPVPVSYLGMGVATMGLGLGTSGGGGEGKRDISAARLSLELHLRS